MVTFAGAVDVGRRDLGLEPLALEALGQRLRDRRLVLDHEDPGPHGSMLPVTFAPKGSERPSHSGVCRSA